MKLFFPMKLSSFLTVLLLAFTLTGMAGKVEQVYHFSGPSVRNVDGYQQLSFNDAMPTALPGQPVLPYRQVNLMLPPGESAIGIEIIFENEVVLSGKYNLYPQQEVRPVSAGSSGNFLKDEVVYSLNESFPSDPKGQLVTAFLNGRSFALSTFTPARYNPVTGKLSYYSTARVVVRTAPDPRAVKALENLSFRSNEPTRLAENKEMDQSYRNRQSATLNNYDLLIVSPAEFSGSFGNMRANYLKEGITSLVVTRDSITASMPGIDVPEKIRNFIIQEYQTHGIQYVLLAGDDEQIPHRGFYCYAQSGSGYSDQNIPADLYYSALDGNWNTDGDAYWGEPGEDDLLPDIAVARLPFSNASELSHMLNKSYKYQFTPVGGEFRNILMAGENLWSNPDTWGSDYLDLLIGTHSDNGYTTTGIPADYLFDNMYDETTYWTSQDLMNHLNQGRPMLNHVGHANETYVMKLGNSDITDENFFGLNGIDHNFTIVYTHGCYCGAFDYNDCIAEKMVTINNFAAAFVGNSRYGWFNEGQTEGPSAHLHREYMNALYSDSLNRIGRAHMESKIASASWVTAPGQWEPGALRWCFYDCNVLGDPALAVFTDNPISISTTYPASVLIGTPAITVNVTSGGSPAHGLTC
ncbi:MAG: C25 family cysteine peptidase, partial [Bacteroidota bacterium]